VLGSAARLPAPSAAFVNGFGIHCLEWDAVHEGAVVHALSVVTAALGAAIDRRGGCDPERALAALAVGVDIASGIGIACRGAMRFFRPATAGVLGAALAVALVERQERVEDVLGLAYSQVAGTMQAHLEGSIALPLQIAHAARAAITAVDLVTAGLRGPQDALEGTFGYFNLFEEGALDTYTDTIGEAWLIEGVSTKPYPSGRASHAVLATLDELMRAGELSGENLQALEVRVPPLVQRLVARDMQPAMSASSARLCLPFLVSLMLKDGHIDPRRFTADTFADSELARVAARVRIVPGDKTDPNLLAPQQLTITLGSGRSIERRIDHVLGSPLAPLSPAQVRDKGALARALAGDMPDLALLDDPLAYFTEPR
jgi:2-methylcitrate dehydratase PrpD